MGKLFIKQKVFSLGGHFTVKDSNEKDKYVVEGSFLSVPKVFTISDMQGTTIGTITKKVFSFLPKFYVDIIGEGSLVIEKELTFFKPSYRIDSKELEIRGDWWQKNYEILRNGEVIGKVAEAWFTIGDFYEIDVLYESLEHTIISLVVAIDFVKQQAQAANSSAGAGSH